MFSGTLAPSGTLDLVHIPVKRASWFWKLKNFILHRAPDMPRLMVARIAQLCGVPTIVSELHLKLVKADGKVINYGKVSTRVVTDAGVAFLVDAWQNLVELEIMKYHGVGTGTNAEAVGDTALQTEVTTNLNPNDTRATGSLAEGATGNIFKTIGTVLFDGSAAVTEHGIFSQAATGGGTLWDRSIFSAINVVSGDAIQATYSATFTSGS